MSCLATGFYPRHINLTLFRDGQPVSDHEIAGGDLLPNDDAGVQTCHLSAKFAVFTLK